MKAHVRVSAGGRGCPGPGLAVRRGPRRGRSRPSRNRSRGPRPSDVEVLVDGGHGRLPYVGAAVVDDGVVADEEVWAARADPLSAAKVADA